MRACFLRQNICNLGYGVAILQAPRLLIDEPSRLPAEADTHVTPGREPIVTEALIGSRPVANPPRADT